MEQKAKTAVAIGKSIAKEYGVPLLELTKNMIEAALTTGTLPSKKSIPSSAQILNAIKNNVASEGEVSNPQIKLDKKSKDRRSQKDSPQKKEQPKKARRTKKVPDSDSKSTAFSRGGIVDYRKTGLFR